MAEIKYKDTVIPVNTGETVQLHLAEKKLTDDIFVTAPKGGGKGSILPTEITTEAEMTSLLETAEIGSIYKYMGTTRIYEYGALYVVELGLINFTIDGVSYEAEDGMTWSEWCNSSYNTDEWRNISVYTGNEIGRDCGTVQYEVIQLNGVNVAYGDAINTDIAYEVTIVSGGGGGSN